MTQHVMTRQVIAEMSRHSCKKSMVVATIVRFNLAGNESDMAKILVVEDDQMLGDTVEQSLLQDQHQVDLVRDGALAMDHLKTIEYDLAVLDWQLPGLSGIDICRRYRSGGGRMPIIMLTAMSKIDNKELGLDSGADDYLTKPFELRELKARIKSLLRRPVQYSGEILQAGLLRLDTKTRQVSRSDNGEVIHLKPNEYAVLEFFLKHPNEVVSPELLLQRVWNTDSESTASAVYICINRIRKKIDGLSEKPLLTTVHGVGYKFVPPAL